MFGTLEVHRSAASLKNNRAPLRIPYWSGIGLRTGSGCTYNF